MTTLAFTQYTFDMELLQGANDRLPDPRELSVGQLLSGEPVATKRGNKPERLRAELHQRLGSGLAGFGFACMAAAIMLGGQFSRRGMTGRVVTAAAAILLLQSGLMWVSNLVARDLFYAPLFYGLALLPVPVSWWLLRRNPLAGRKTAEA